MGAEGPDKKRVRGSNIVNVLLISCRRELRCVNSCVCANVCMCRLVYMCEHKYEFFCQGVCVCVTGVMSGYITAYCWVE